MVTITEAKLRQNVYETIYDLLTATSFSVAGVKVTASFIDDDSALPQIVINPSNVDLSNRTFGRGAFDEEIRLEIELWTKKNKDIDVLSDEVLASLTAASYNGMMYVGSQESNAFEPQNNNKVHLKTIVSQFMRKG